MTKTVKIIFTISLVLNLLFLGGAISAYVHHPEKVQGWKEVRETLAPETRDLMKVTFKEKKQEVLPLFKEAHKKKQEMKKVMTAKAFDPEAFDGLAIELKSIKADLLDHKLEVIKTVLSKLPQEERAKLAKHIAEKLFGDGGRDGRKDRPRRSDNNVRHGAVGKPPHLQAIGEIKDAPER